MRAVVIGGTGSLGSELISRLLENGDEVVCFSRDELKQKELAARLQHPSRLRFIIGDIRDRDSVHSALRGAHVCFLTAALKHVDSMEIHPEESVKTNILGVMNVADAAIANHVLHVVFSSTDKAVDPINVYGQCKAISEKILLRRNQTQAQTRFHVYRWGNVAASRGAVLATFAKSLRERSRVHVTSALMSRFWIRIEDAVSFMLTSYASDPGEAALIPPIKAASVLRVIEAIARREGIARYDVELVGLRLGEKIHESLTSAHGPLPHMNSESWHQYTDDELDALISDALSKAEAA